MKSFRCGICEITFPSSIVNEHHKIPKALGGSDDSSNLILLCNGCHQSLHSIAFMLVNPKRLHEAEPTIAALFPQKLDARRNIREFASLVAREMALRKEIKKEASTELRTVIELPALYMELIRLSGYDMPGKTGRGAGVNRVIRNWVADELGKKFPLRKSEIESVRKAKK